jgi:putative hydrolase of the HAD superfamily
MIEAVLFDWTDTLVSFEWSDDVLAEGHRAALGRDDPAFTERYRELVLGGGHSHRPYVDLLSELGVDDPNGFIEREHEVWQAQHSVLASAQALLESLRNRGVRTGLVANAWPDPSHVLRRDVEAYGLAPLLDVMVFSDEAGARKPDAEIFLRTCLALEVEPTDAMFVGDDLRNDVQGAANVGMTTVQALWFRADDTSGIEPDFMAFTPMDVLNAVRRLAT